MMSTIDGLFDRGLNAQVCFMSPSATLKCLLNNLNLECAG